MLKDSRIFPSQLPADSVLWCSQEGADVDWDRLLDPVQEELVRAKVAELGQVGLGELKGALPEEISYFTIRAVLAGKSG